MHKKRFISLMLLAILMIPNLAFLPAQPAQDAPYTWGSGADGDLTINAESTYNIHSTNHPGRTCAGGGDAVSYQVIGLTPNTATLNTSPNAGCLTIGDEVMLINLQGSSANTGNYELLRIKNLSASLVTFTTNKTTSFGAHAGDDSGLGTTQHVVLQRVPNYNNLTLNGNLVANGWNGQRFGLLAFKVKGNWIGSGSINLDATGYRGGGPNGGGARQGESWPGMGTALAIPNGGGGAGRNPGDAGCPGGQGNYAGGANNQVCTTPNGDTYGSAPVTRLFLGSGGGGRGDGTGGNGGGVVFAAGNNVNFLGTITVRGQNGQNTGAGSGGSIRIEGDKLALGSLIALGAQGMNGATSGVGRIALYYTTSLSASFSRPAPYSQKVSSPTASPSPTTSTTANVAQTATALSLTLTAQNTPNYNATGTALAQTMTAQAGTPDNNATGTAFALTTTAQAGTPDYNATGTALALTTTAQAGTPDYNATGTALAQTATALAGTPDYNATGTALAETATAFSQTDTPTPDYNATATSDALTATAESNNSPTPDFFASATALSRTATAFAASPTPDLNATGTAQALTATAAVTATPTPDLNATGTAQALTATAVASGGNGSGSGSGSGSSDGTPTPSSTIFGLGLANCALTLNVYVYIDTNNDSIMAAQGEGVNALQVNFLDTSYGKVGQGYTVNGKSAFCVPDYLRGQTVRVDIPYLQRTGILQVPDDNNKNQPLEMWFRLDPPALPVYIP